jgi:hypothetical protein
MCDDLTFLPHRSEHAHSNYPASAAKFNQYETTEIRFFKSAQVLVKAVNGNFRLAPSRLKHQPAVTERAVQNRGQQAMLPTVLMVGISDGRALLSLERGGLRGDHAHGSVGDRRAGRGPYAWTESEHDRSGIEPPTGLLG